MLWNIPVTHSCPTSQFETWNSPSEVLYEFNGPRIFTTTDGSLSWLWYECAEDDLNNSARYLVVPCNERLISNLKNGIKTVHDSLSQPWLWAIDVDFSSNSIIAGWVLGSLDEVPQEAQPRPDALLWPELQPLLSYRLIGEGLKEGYVPASVIKRAITNPTAALKVLLETISEGATSLGRPTKVSRRLYDVVAKRFAYNSFEIVFDFPDSLESELLIQEQGQELLPEIESASVVECNEKEAIYEQASIQLKQALTWLNDEADTTTPELGMLSVLEQFAPPKHGQVKEVELKGRIISSHTPVLLTREHTGKIKATLRELRKEEPLIVTLQGRIGEFDKDKFLCTLRDIVSSASSGDVLCSFPEELYDDIYDAFDSDKKLKIQGLWRVSGPKMLDLINCIQLDECK